MQPKELVTFSVFVRSRNFRLLLDFRNFVGKSRISRHFVLIRRILKKKVDFRKKRPFKNRYVNIGSESCLFQTRGSKNLGQNEVLLMSLLPPVAHSGYALAEGSMILTRTVHSRPFALFLA